MKLVLICLSFVLALTTAWNAQCDRKTDYGDCHKHVTMWAYSRYDKKCNRFDYSGCGGNENRYLSKFQCELECFPLRDPLTPSPFNNWFKN